MTATSTIADHATRTSSSSATVSCTSAIPDKYGHVPITACNAYYNFYPNFDGNLAFAVLFGLTMVAHLVQAVMFKKRYCWVIIMGAIWETVGFTIRTLGAHDQQSLQYAIWGTLLFLLAPLWINAFAYMTVARMIHFSLPDKKIWGVRAVRLTVIFVWLDVICFLVQAGGGSMLSSNNSASTIRLGQHLYMAGIGIQLVFIFIFSTMTCHYYYKLRQLEGKSMGPIKYLIWTLLAVLTLVMIRIIYRLIEFGPGVGENNPIITHEDYAFCLDALPMILALVLLNVMHPGFVLRGPDSEFPKLSRAQKKALKQQRKDEKQRRKDDKERRKLGRYDMELSNTSYPEDRRSSDNENDRAGLMV